ncbi:MAG: hypothetical protein LBH64_00030 [Coriobacteriales bacterium]|nr:hypothetical protein [Coriobacteriales bacterium]
MRWGRSAALVLITMLALLMVQPRVALAEPNTTIVGLTNAGQQLEGQSVTFQGEVVGDILNAEEGYKWLMLQDGGASISVLVAEHEISKVTRLGRYGQIGTRLEVSGRFRTDCPDHDGLTDVHATKLVVIDEGSVSESRFVARELEVGALLIIVGLCLLVVHWRLRERTR